MFQRMMRRPWWKPWRINQSVLPLKQGAELSNSTNLYVLPLFLLIVISIYYSTLFISLDLYELALVLVSCSYCFLVFACDVLIEESCFCCNFRSFWCCFYYMYILTYLLKYFSCHLICMNWPWYKPSTRCDHVVLSLRFPSFSNRIYTFHVAWFV